MKFHLLLVKNKKKTVQDKIKKESNSNDIQCRNCGKVGHWTLHCPYKDQQEQNQNEPTVKRDGLYQIPKNRRGVRGPSENDTTDDSKENSTIRVTNLSEDTTEEDLDALFRPFGSISRIFFGKR